MEAAAAGPSEPAAGVPSPALDPRRSLIGLSRQALAEELAAAGEKPFRARQLWHWLYFRGAADFAAMSSLPKDLRARLDERYTLARPARRP